MTSISVGKTDREVERWRAREEAFYAQTIDENNQRLNDKWATISDLNALRQATLDEIKFLQSQLLARP